MTGEQWSMTTRERDEQWNECERVLTVRGKGGASVGKVERRVPTVCKLCGKHGNGGTGDELRRNQSNGVIMRLSLWGSGKR